MKKDMSKVIVTNVEEILTDLRWAEEKDETYRAEVVIERYKLSTGGKVKVTVRRYSTKEDVSDAQDN